MNNLDMAVFAAVAAGKGKSWTVQDYHRWYVEHGLLPKDGYEKKYGPMPVTKMPVTKT